MDDYTTMSGTLEDVLKRYRDLNGNVDYFSMMGDAGTVAFAESLATFDLSTLDTREKSLAFWINCYNALSIYGVIRKLKEDPDFVKKGNSSWLGRVRFFALQKFDVGGEQFTLRQIENNIRKNFKDPRIHFALNCSSMGCPVLKDGRYSAENIDVELDEASKLYIGSPAGASLDEESNILYVSMVFKWYKKDFEATGKSIPEYVLQYIPEDKKNYLETHLNDIKVKYLDYDWSLNLSDEVE
ncbi:MAG: DUF547 domain-containing protein [Candidatus Thorarchaeota archaeon]